MNQDSWESLDPPETQTRNIPTKPTMERVQSDLELQLQLLLKPEKLTSFADFSIKATAYTVRPAMAAGFYTQNCATNSPNLEEDNQEAADLASIASTTTPQCA